MKLEIGDIVEFKKYEDMTDDENMWIGKKFFPLSGKVKEINVSGCDRYFRITGSKYIFSKESVARVIKSADVDYCFIVQEDHYDMYIGGTLKLVCDKNKAKIYTSWCEADKAAEDMFLDEYNVIPYDD